MNIKQLSSDVFKIMKKDLKAIKKNEIVMITLIAIIIIPSLYALLNISACWDPYGNTSNLMFAVVNNDKGTTYNGESINIGDRVVENLKNNTDFDWQFVSEDEGRQGIENGTYFAALIIPSDFSDNVFSITSDNPKIAEIEYIINQKKNPVSSRMCDAAEKSIKEKINSEIVKEIDLAAFSKLGKLQSGLSSGASQMSSGASQLNSGAAQVTSGASQVSSGASELSSGAEELSSGADQLSEGTSAIGEYTNDTTIKTIAQKTEELSTGADQLSSGANELSSGANQVASGSSYLATSSANALSTAASSLSSSASSLSSITSISEDSLGNYFYSPTTVNKTVINEVDNYGSEVAPFYLVLSIWVGCIVTCVMLKTGYPKPKFPPLTLYFGKMGLFLILALLQTTVTLIGSFYLGIQVKDPAMFVISMYFISIVLMVLIYSLISVFGNVGKAIALVLLVIQISGTGGIYPVEVMTDFFQFVSPYMPMTYAIQMIRECCLGLYVPTYLFTFGVLLGILIATLLISTLLKEKFDESSNYFERCLKDSGLF